MLSRFHSPIGSHATDASSSAGMAALTVIMQGVMQLVMCQTDAHQRILGS